ncbi:MULTISPECIES: UvrD-helicase domain-containing protein [Marichromatium]|uniref:ATP-dependent DNA helicase Rep n=1 Tax=Marichromatium gracile TaxID=1048 RepID=A0A4R4AID5_MARGR|nr:MULTISPECIES: UvrD-helicase domain-containing protein [Marichromatium]MBK1708386.1 ATP-dependent DNA helicase Rep [Marichromatium gracile]MBO8087010.1 UvrD-helicase domain-containing protein [Marichromatium sp.]RNE89514.1 ATP-dependent DNA helicase Rep [Marichromatium sp. AB31]TCW38486.1 ATP-dependent DNA helicase Rep [Marichromatium gracile]
MSGLNPRQRQAVRYTDGPLLVLAGAGSGKTRVITRKIAHLIDHGGLKPRHIRAVTFTNKAAREMRARIGQQLQGTDTRGLAISTFHTLGLEILRRDPEPAGLRPGFSLLDAQDVESVLKEHLRQSRAPDSIAPGALQQRISRWKNDTIGPAEALSRAEDAFEAELAGLYADYERSLRAYNAVDFDDLILAPARLLTECQPVREAWRARIRYLLVDEYQDTNGAQYELVRLLAGPEGAFTVVGDDDQSIYAWRGARPENLARLREDYPRLEIIMLEQNYRSSARILGLANTLIANNPHVFEKRLWSELGPGEPARVLRCRDERDEAERVTAEILHLHHAERVAFGDIAILYRGNHQARLFEQALRVHDIPYFLSGGTSFFARTEVKDVMAYLRLLANPEDDAALLRVVNTPRREIGPSTLERLAAHARAEGTSLFAACADPALAEHLNPRQRDRLGAFTALIREQARAAAGDPPTALRTLVERIDYPTWLRENASSQQVAERRYENVEDLLKWLGTLHRDTERRRGLGDLVAHLALLDVLERQDEEEGGDRVSLMTLHAAKGLEFPHVFLVGMEEELLPHRTSIEEDTIEEERRLAYVGITRAQRGLTFTLARRRRRYGEWVRSEPSRFLAELPEDDLIWEGGPKADPERSKARGRSHLDMLKEMLGS